MNKLITIPLLVLCSVFFIPAAQAVTVVPTQSTAVSSPKGSFNVLLKALGDWQSLKQQRSEKEIALRFEENLSFPSLKEIERLEAKIAAENQNLEEINIQYLEVESTSGQTVFLESIELKQSQIESLVAEKANFEETYVARKDKQQASIKQFKQDLEDLGENIEKQQELIQKQISQSFEQFILIFGLVCLLLLIKFLAGRLVIKLSNHLSEQRQSVLFRLNRLTFNLLIFLVLLGTISSQLVSLLPFIALLGTGIAFAVRDALSSFLGWFLIGGDTGYRKGQIIKLGDYYGRVYEVTPFLTMIKEIKGDHETGEIISFPNKVIFEQPISHFSKYLGFVHKELKFLISEDSDIDAAKSLLKTTIDDIIANEREKNHKSLKALIQQYNLEGKDISPLIWVENNNHGLELKSRFLVKLQTAAYTKVNIEESFIKAVQVSEDVALHYTDSGRNQASTGLRNKADRDADHFSLEKLMRKILSNTAERIGNAPGTLSYQGNKSDVPVKLDYWEENSVDFKRMESNELPNIKPEKQWINVQGLHDLNLLKRLGEKFEIHNLILEDILNPSQRPKVETVETCVFVSLKALQIDVNHEIKATTISLAVIDSTLFSFSELDQDQWLKPIINRLKKPKSAIQTKNIYYLLYALVDILVDQYLFVLESVGDQIQEIDQSIFENADSAKLDELYQLKKQLLYLTKQTQPVTELIRKVPNEIEENTWEAVKIYFDDLLDHSVQVQDIVKTYSDALSNLFDLYFSLVNLRMNKTIQALTVITVIFLPLSLLAGIYGMNFAYMPGVSVPQAFWIMTGSMLLLSVGILWFLKRKNWF